jgi:hypothetical protein
MDYGASAGQGSANAAQIIGTFAILTLPFLVLAAVLIIANWKIYKKAGQPGWAAIVPFYNIYVLMEIIGRPGWWLILFFIPVVSFVIGIIVALDLARVFGKSPAFGVIGLWLFSIVGYPMLAFGKSQYVGPTGGPGGSPDQAAPLAPVAPPAPPSL